MPKPTKQQIRDAVDEELGNSAHLGVEFAVQSVMDQYDISGLDVALAYIKEPDNEETTQEEADEQNIAKGTDGQEASSTSTDHADTAGDTAAVAKTAKLSKADRELLNKVSSKPAGEE